MTKSSKKIKIKKIILKSKWWAASKEDGPSSSIKQARSQWKEEGCCSPSSAKVMAKNPSRYPIASHTKAATPMSLCQGVRAGCGITQCEGDSSYSSHHLRESRRSMCLHSQVLRWQGWSTIAVIIRRQTAQSFGSPILSCSYSRRLARKPTFFFQIPIEKICSS